MSFRFIDIKYWIAIISESFTYDNIIKSELWKHDINRTEGLLRRNDHWEKWLKLRWRITTRAPATLWKWWMNEQIRICIPPITHTLVPTLSLHRERLRSHKSGVSTYPVCELSYEVWHFPSLALLCGTSSQTIYKGLIMAQHLRSNESSSVQAGY